MLMTTLPQSYIKRTIRPLYAWTQATPSYGYLDPAWNRSVPIYPGMCFMKTTGTNYTLINGTGYPAGLVGQFIGGYGIDELLNSSINALAVWVLGPDAQFQIQAPAFDSSLTWTDPGDGTDALIYARTVSTGTPTPATTTGLQGQLVPSGTSNATTHPVCRLISVDSTSQITIAGLTVRAGTAG